MDQEISRIEEFKGEYAFLSNFQKCEVVYDGVAYPTVEHAYQAAKTESVSEREMIKACKTPAAAKKAGRKVVMRAGWDSRLKYGVMEDLVWQKFQDPVLRDLLLQTGDAVIIEGNTWNDTYWGVCRGRGKNMLGKILMNVRELLRGNP